jgi:hypothetical protein
MSTRSTVVAFWLVLLAGCAHTTPCPGEAEKDSIEVSPGRNPEQVRAELRKAVDGIADVSARTELDLPNDADSRTRVHFVLRASGEITPRSVDSLVLNQDLVAHALAKAKLSPALADVDVTYEFRTPHWKNAQVALRERWLSALRDACTAVANGEGDLEAYFVAQAELSKLPEDPQHIGKVWVGRMFFGILGEDASDRLIYTDKGLEESFCECGVVTESNFAAACPGPASRVGKNHHCRVRQLSLHSAF